MRSALICTLLMIFVSGGVQAQEPKISKPLTYRVWKLEQEIQARNHLARSSNRVQMMKNNGVEDKRALEALKSAQGEMRYAEDLTIDDYISVYLSQLTDAELRDLATSLSKEEMADMFVRLTRYQTLRENKAASADNILSKAKASL